MLLFVYGRSWRPCRCCYRTRRRSRGRRAAGLSWQAPDNPEMRR
ncbi:hypothetical protein SZ55_3844 [Pseudomonas sp. FeS53a]|nr:hypothetical protein SZ55_3844 [Pseudomonas sp. FeS53a]